MRLAYGQAGRYVLKNAKGVFSVFRIKKEIKYTPSMRGKIFALRDMESLSGSMSEYDMSLLNEFDLALGAGAYNEFIEDLEAEAFESDSAQPGSRNKAAGAKLGKKTRAPGMLAPGWHMFELAKGDSKVKKHYIGPRISGRRLVGIVSGEPAKKPAAKPAAKKPAKQDPKEQIKTENLVIKEAKSLERSLTKQTKAIDTLKSRFDKITDKTKKKEMAAKLRSMNEELRVTKRSEAKVKKEAGIIQKKRAKSKSK
jgi:hypothetical protein